MTDPRTARPYAKAHLDVMRRRDLCPTAKLVLVARQRLVGLGEFPSPTRLMYETGLTLRQVHYSLTTLGLQNPTGRPPKGNKKGYKKGDKKGGIVCHLSGPHITDNNNRELKRAGGEETTAPAPQVPAVPQKTTATTAAPGAPSEGRPDALVSMLVLRFGGRFSAAEIAGHVASDTAAGAYSREELAAWYAAGRTAAYPSHLKRLVRQFVTEDRLASFAARLAAIRAAGLTDARHADGRQAQVRLVDTSPPRLILETSEGGVAGATAAELEGQIGGLRWPFVGSAREQGLRRRLEAVLAGLPDPAARPGLRTQIVVSSPTDLAGWSFRSAQPALFDMEKSP